LTPGAARRRVELARHKHGRLDPRHVPRSEWARTVVQILDGVKPAQTPSNSCS
jgi:hypothetical protein